MKNGFRVHSCILIALFFYGFSAMPYAYAQSINSLLDTQFIELDLSSENTLAKDEISTYIVFIENRSQSSDLIEKVILSCGCSRAILSNNPVDPGKKSEVKIEVHGLARSLFRIERAITIWKSGHVTQVILAKKDAFGVFLSETSLSWDIDSHDISKKVLVYMDSQTFPHLQINELPNIITTSTTGAFKAHIEKVDAKDRCIVLSIVRVDPQLTTDIIRVSIPTTTGNQQSFILCKLENFK